MDKPFIFAYDAGRPEAEGIAGCLGTSLAEHEERIFQDGERKVRPLVDPRGRDALVVQSLYDGPSRSVHDKLCDALLFAGTLKDSGAARVILIAPYLCYARQDRRTKPGEPLSLRYVAQLIEAAGVDAIVTLDVHNPAAFENAFRIPTANIECTELFAAHFGKALADQDIEVISPDIGGVKRAERFRDALSMTMNEDVELGTLGKRRLDHIVSDEETPSGVRERTVVIFDDMIASGSTMLRAVKACRRGGAAYVILAATHGLFLPGAQKLVASSLVDRIIISDTIPPFRLDAGLVTEKVTILSASQSIADGIRSIVAA
ncbi:ribose-phosphate diphosphokinase [Bradyrhizobium sp. SSUT112]|uniref:ribose-phosphate diphosphokinase n=1 Tax=Bradyrhizobium sp. SSUT112 TaxID=3040604 RepID=UPI0024469348|nr:ribose-phosphate diphosphokinase [Bradyrhizobium sp. SSUT112]MDH2351918.1 ribose-phosphate diphosphokinase [Bradyrhizobium sp. SSUT112]